MPIKEKRISEIEGIILFALTIFIFLSLISYEPTDIAYYQQPPNTPAVNWMGKAGAYLAFGLNFVMGYGAYLIILVTIVWGVKRFRGMKFHKKAYRALGVLLLLVSSCILLSSKYSLILEQRLALGGYLGIVLSNGLKQVFGALGAYLIAVTVLVVSLPLAAEVSYPKFFSLLGRGILSFFRRVKGIFSRKPRPSKPITIKRPEVKEEEVAPVPKRVKKIAKKTPEEEKVYTLPDLSLLVKPKTEEAREDLKAKSALLEETLSEFGISAKVIGALQGPVITRFEVQPAKGVTVSSITSRSNDIALKLAAP
ncbi:DNA translocase FtsK 4TM domain-containing protein, partial [bacterium]|nr:DNA translocase FtsK 4TM domain-containing protein [bacterium]